MRPSVILFWFRRDLRFKDNTGLYHALKLAQKLEQKVLPIFIFDKMILDKLEDKADRRVEFFNKKNTTIKVRIGKIIHPSDDLYHLDTTTFGKFLRAKTYALGHTVDVKKFFKFPEYPIKKLNNIDEEVHDLILHNEINSLDNYKLFDWGDYDVYAAPTNKIPKIIQQIGVLREKTFRAVGEGTGKCMDLDQYDLYYDQLFIWDRVNSKIVGGYRIGKGKDIIQTYKKQGFYFCAKIFYQFR